MELTEKLKELGQKPSISEENGIKALRENDLIVFSPGISSGGFAEIRMAITDPKRKVIATTIDNEGLDFSIANIYELGLDSQIETKIEDLTKEYPYPDNYFDYIYARLVLHYLSFQELNEVLDNFRKSLKDTGHLFIVVRSEKNVDRNKPDQEYDPNTRLTKVYYRDENKNIIGSGVRYFHTPATIREHLEKSGFNIDYIKEYQEQLYKDFMRTKIAPRLDHVIEVHTTKI